MNPSHDIGQILPPETHKHLHDSENESCQNPGNVLSFPSETVYAWLEIVKLVSS